MSNFQELRDLAADFLGEEGQAQVNEHLDNSEDRQARIFLLGALDGLMMKNVLSNEVLREHYAKLGLDHDTIAKIRSDNMLI